MKKSLLLALLIPSTLLLSGCSFDNASISSSAVVAKTDMSLSYLGMIFGSVGSGVNGVSGQMMAQIFSVFNQGVLCAAGLWLIYTLATLLVSAVTDGNFQKKNPAMACARVALGVALIIPNQTGYNVIQKIMMKVVVEGISLADMVWNNSLDYLNAGGDVWHQPQTADGQHAGGKYSGSTNSAAGYSTVMTKIMGNLNPTATTNQTLLQSNWEKPIVAKNGYNYTYSTLLSPPGSGNQPYLGMSVFLSDVCMVKASETSKFSPSPVLGTVANNPALLFPGAQKSANIDPNNAQCGYIGLNSVGTTTNNACTTGDMQYNSLADQNGNLDQNNARCVYLKDGVQKMANDLMPAAIQVACGQEGAADKGYCAGFTPPSVSSKNDIIGESFLTAFLDYINAETPAENLHSGKKNKATDFIDNARKEGWVNAGRYYWDMARIVDHETQGDVALGDYTPTNRKAPSAQNSYNALSSSSGIATPTTTLAGGVATAYTKLTNYFTTSQKGATSVGTGFSANIASGIGGEVLNLIFGPVYALGMAFTTYVNGGLHLSPILWISHLGMDMMGSAISIFATVSGVIFGLSFASMICMGQADAALPIEWSFNLVKPPMWVILGALFFTGVTLAYWVPVYPFVIFTFGVINWLIAVIEAMVAAPLVAFGLTHPDNHDLLGASQQALMLGLSIFLRPVLMIIGLIGGMILSYVSLRIVIYAFTGFSEDLFSPNPVGTVGIGDQLAGAAAIATSNVFKGSGGTLGISTPVVAGLAFPIMLIIFTKIVMEIINTCFNLIFVIPDYTLRWIGAPQSMQAVNAAQIGSAIQGGVSAFGGKSEQFASEVGRYANDKKKESAGGTGDGGKGGGSPEGGNTVELTTPPSE